MARDNSSISDIFTSSNFKGSLGSLCFTFRAKSLTNFVTFLMSIKATSIPIAVEIKIDKVKLFSILRVCLNNSLALENKRTSHFSSEKASSVLYRSSSFFKT